MVKQKYFLSLYFILQMPSSDLTLKEFEQLGICENELLQTIVNNDKEIMMLKALLNGQQLIKQNGKF